MKYGFDMTHPEDIKVDPLIVMDIGEKYSVEDIMRLIPELENNRVTAYRLLDNLVDIEILNTYVGKDGRKYYTISDE